MYLYIKWKLSVVVVRRTNTSYGTTILQANGKDYEFSYDIKYRVGLVYFQLTMELSFIN